MFWIGWKLRLWTRLIIGFWGPIFNYCEEPALIASCYLHLHHLYIITLYGHGTCYGFGTLLGIIPTNGRKQLL